MLAQITDEELDIYEDIFNPVCLAECLFHDLDNMSLFDREEFCEIRKYQYPLISFEYCIDDKNPKLSQKENFALRCGAGDVYCFGGRAFGKTLITEKVDIPLNYMCTPGEWVGFSSFDAGHIIGVMEDVVQTLEEHPVLKMFKPKVKRSPAYRITNKQGWTLESVNQNQAGKNPGANWFQKHFTRIYIEEASHENQVCYEKRLDAISELGCIYRIAGMTDFTPYSPAGQVFYNSELQSKVVNLPQYVSVQWDEKSKEEARRKHSGENSISYRIFVKGEICEEGITVFDMEKVKACYDKDKIIKHFEVSKKNFSSFRNLILAEACKNAEATYLMSDIGETAPSEITIFNKVGDKYRYDYNITLYGLTDKEQAQIFLWLTQKIKATYVGLDCGDGTGRAIFRRLEESLPRERMIWYDGSMNIAVGFEKDEQGRTVYKDGMPVKVEEKMALWSVKHLKDLFYDEALRCPMDHKLDLQLNSVVSVTTGSRVRFECIAKEDHLFDSFKIFSIAHWLNELNVNNPMNVKKFCKVGC